MNQKRLNELLRNLHKELEQTENVDEDTIGLLQELEADLHRLGDSEGKDPETILGQAQALEARFAAEHPTAERFFREVMDILSKVGI